MCDSDKQLTEKVLNFVKERRDEIERITCELIQEAQHSDLDVKGIEDILDLELPSSQKEYNIVKKLQKTAAELQSRLEECDILAMSDLDIYDFLLDEGKLSQKKVLLVAKKVFLYRDLREDIEADLVEQEIKNICLSKGIKEGTLNKIFKNKGKVDKNTQETCSHLEVYGYDEMRQVWLGFRGYVEIVSHASLKTQLPIILGPDIDLKEVISFIQRKAHKNGRICQKRTIGRGIHFISDKWVLVSGKRALCIDPTTFERTEITSPLFEEDYLVDLGGKEWIDLNFIDPSKSPENCLETCFRELAQIISNWEWRHSEAVFYVTAFTMLTLFQQALNPWRPIIYLSGAQGTGKTMFSGLLDNLFHGFLEILDKTTAHAIKQTFGNNAMPGFFDEFEHYESEKRQKDILNLLKTSCRGGVASFGTIGKSARECHLNHLFWLASISFPRCMETDGAVRERMIVFDLKKKQQKFLRLPPSKELRLLGSNFINAIIKNWKRLENSVQDKLKIDQPKENVDARQIENFVWASCLIDLARKVEPIDKEKTIVPKWAINKKEDDGDRIIEEILQTKVKDGMNEYFVSDLIYRAVLGFHDIGSVESRTRGELLDGSSEALNLLRLNHLTITKKEGVVYLGIHTTKLGTFFEKREIFSGLDIKTILGRLEFIQFGKVKFGVCGLKALLIPITEIDRILGRDYLEPVPTYHRQYTPDDLEDQEEVLF